MPTALAAPPHPRPVLWYDLPTPAGRFTLSPVKPERDLPLIHRWMNDPEVAAYWALDGPLERTADHVHAQLARAGTQPLLARLSGRAIGYWELYQAAEDPLAAYYPAEPTDLGVHLLIGEADCRGLGLGGLLLRVLADAAQRQRPRRLVAEPDERNLASVRAFARAGFAAAGTLELPDKRATLMLRPAPQTAASAPAPLATATALHLQVPAQASQVPGRAPQVPAQSSQAPSSAPQNWTSQAAAPAPTPQAPTPQPPAGEAG